MLLNFVYLIALFCFSPVLLYEAIKKGKYRTGWSEKLWGAVPKFAARQSSSSSSEQVEPKSVAKKRIWVHAVSVGEVNLAVGLVKELQATVAGKTVASEVDIVVSTTTVTGYELAQKRFGEDQVFYCPFDLTWAINKTLDRIQPDLITLIELEIWPNWLRLAERRKIPVAVVNGRLSEKSFRGYRKLRSLLQRTFSRLSLVAAQDGTYAYRFREMGAREDRVHVTGSMKFDDAPLSRDTEEIGRFRHLANCTSNESIFVAGSTQTGEETIILEAYRELVKHSPNLRLIIVPRHAERFEEVAKLIRDAQFECRRRSQLVQPEPGLAERSSWTANEILLIDSIGELRSWWGLADIAFVGGSLGSRGGQNMLEPSGYGAAVCFGPNTRNFRDIVGQLLENNAAKVVFDANSIQAFVSEMLENPDVARRMGANAQKLIKQHQGARKKTAELLLSLLDSSQPSP